MRQHLAAKFGLESQSLLSLRVEPEHAGVIEINGVRAGAFPWSGPLFDDVPFQLTARANFGYEFAGWSAPFGADESIAVALSEALSLTAHFLVIKEGVTADMQPYKERMGDEDIWHLVNYLKTLSR